MSTSQNVPERPDSIPQAELDSVRWAVISFERCEASGLTYSQAAAKMFELDALRIAGLCLVTQETAERVKT